MPKRFQLAILALLTALAAGGYMAVREWPALVSQYQQAHEFSPVWGYIYLGLLSSCAMGTLGLAGWTLAILIRATTAKQSRRAQRSRNPSQMSLAEQNQEAAEHLAEVQRQADDPSLPSDAHAPLHQSLQHLEAKRQSQRLEIVAFGTISSGKSSLLNALAGREVFRTDPQGGTTATRSEIAWPGTDKVVLVDTPGLGEIRGAERAELAQRVARDADLVLLVVDGPLKDFEHAVLAQLAEMEKRVLICLNKEDWFADDDRQRLVAQLREQTAGLVASEDIVTLRARATVRTRVRVLADGREIEESVAVEPDITALADRMLVIIQGDGRSLLTANLLLQARGLASEAKLKIQSTLDHQAEEVVSRAMWRAAATAALSPLPMLDVAAGLAISSNMVLSLARVYRQSIDLDAASRLVAELGKNLVAILGTSAAAPAIGSAIASILKTAPGVGTIAGGLLQALVQALVTRWIGRVFIVYFRGEMREPSQGWAQLAREKWSEVTQPAELASMVKTALARLGERRP